KDLRADAGFVLNHALAGGVAVELAARVNMNLRKFSGLVGLIDAEAAAGVMKIEKDAATFFRNRFKRALNQILAIARRGAEDVAGQAVRMNADERGRIAFEIAADERHMLIVIDVA